MQANWSNFVFLLVECRDARSESSRDSSAQTKGSVEEEGGQHRYIKDEIVDWPARDLHHIHFPLGMLFVLDSSAAATPATQAASDKILS